MPFRLQCKSGRLLLDSLSITASLHELQSVIAKKTGVQPNKQKILYGFPPHEISSYISTKSLTDLGIRNGDTLILQELDSPRHEAAVAPTPSDGVEEESPCNTEGNVLSRRVVPADNSCLFKSISILLCQEMSCAELRELVAGIVTSQPEVYTPAVLGKPTEDYVSWILKEDSWGGAIEVSIFSQLFSTEVDVVDIQTKRIEKFGEDVYSNRSLLLYDGIHYDPLVLCDHHGKVVQTVFPVSDGTVLHTALQIATDANKARQYTDVANFTLRCLVCSQLLKGHNDAQGHAKSTGHINFGEV